MKTLGKAMDPKFWESVREKDCYKKFRDDLHTNWVKHCEIPIYALSYSKFILFKKTGDRNQYQAEYFTRRQALNTSALLSLIYPEEEKYLVRLMDEIYAICDEYTWCLPAHQGDLDKNNNVRIDLFAAETGFTLSEIYILLGDRLEPLILDRIRVEIDRRITEPFTSVENYGWWEKGVNNWNAVCTGSVVGALIHMHPEIIENMLPRIDNAVSYYLSGFESDGMCLEGCGYWHYGFGFFTVLADMLRTFTDGRVDYFKIPKVKTIATFIQKMYLSGTACVSFADGGRKISFHLGLVHYLKDEYPNDVIAYSPEYSYDWDGCGRWCLHLRSALWLNEEYYYNPASNDVISECYAHDSQWFVKRTPNYGFAAKGGRNNEHHNHNDVGTFIFAKNGRQVITDLGSGPYTRQYFANDTRYTMIECSSRGHCVPIINGAYQKPGGDYRSKDTKYENGIFSTDIAGAYGIEELKSLVRAFSFTNDTVTMTDKVDYTGEGAITERIIVNIEPKIEGNTVIIEDVTITFDPAQCDVVINSEPRTNGKEICYEIDFTLKGSEFSITIK